MKARLSGILLISVGLLKKCQDDQEKMVIILKLLQSLASSSKKSEISMVRTVHDYEFSGVNADSLGKLGCLNLLVKLLIKAGQKDYLVMR